MESHSTTSVSMFLLSHVLPEQERPTASPLSRLLSPSTKAYVNWILKYILCPISECKADLAAEQESCDGVSIALYHLIQTYKL